MKEETVVAKVGNGCTVWPDRGNAIVATENPRCFSCHKPVTKATVDTIDCVAFKPAVQRKSATLEIGDIVEITGELRRRFWKTGAGVASRMEVEVSKITSIKH